VRGGSGCRDGIDASIIVIIIIILLLLLRNFYSVLILIYINGSYDIYILSPPLP